MRFCLAALIFLGSCTHLVEFSKTLPPEIKLPEGEQQILFLSRFDTTQVQFEDSLDARTLSAAYAELIKGLAEGFDTIPHVNLTLSDSVASGQGYRFTDEVSFQDSLALAALQRQYPQYYLLTLDLFNAAVAPFDVVSSGFDTETWSYDVITEAALSLRNPKGQVIDQIIVDAQEEVRYRQRISYLTVHPTIQAFPEKTQLLARKLGKNYAELYIEVPAQVTREYYNGKELNAAADLMAAKKWPAAREILLPLTEHENPRVAAKAAHNLSVVYEALGDEEASRRWFSKAQQ